MPTISSSVKRLPVVPRLGAPIVLVHGLLGFDRLTVFGYTLASYFPGIPEFLRSGGNSVQVATVSPTSGVADRAAQLKAFLNRQYPGEAVHLMGHSMGGLDARYMISRLGMAQRVLSLTTLGTPHRGTAFADWGVNRFERVLKPVLDLLCFPHQAFYDLTTERCRRFNDEVPDAARVRYFSVAGKHEGSWLRPRWKISHDIVHQAEGANDGIVSQASATYGESCAIWDGDHLSLANQFIPGDKTNRFADYVRLVQRLADEGF